MKIYLYKGLPCCRCLYKWLPVYERELIETGNLVGPLKVYQLIGHAEASANTHLPAGAYDVTDGIDGDGDVKIAREMGSAEWTRRPPAFILHRHGVLRGCPHNAGARYQIDALDGGFNGLGSGGRGGPDDGPRDFTVRTWQEGIRWAKRRQRIRAIDKKIEAAIGQKNVLNNQLAKWRKNRNNLKNAA